MVAEASLLGCVLAYGPGAGHSPGVRGCVSRVGDRCPIMRGIRSVFGRFRTLLVKGSRTGLSRCLKGCNTDRVRSFYGKVGESVAPIGGTVSLSMDSKFIRKGGGGFGILGHVMCNEDKLIGLRGGYGLTFLPGGRSFSLSSLLWGGLMSG